MSQDIKKFLSETQMLKRIRHGGVRLAGVSDPDCIASHICVTVQIAYVLAKLEGVDAQKCAVMALFHDNEEARTGDHHKVSARYLNTKQAEIDAEGEHFANLPDDVEKELVQMQGDVRERNTKEGIIVQDADWLEIAIQAKIYLELGHKGCQVWIDNVRKALETESAKKLLAEIEKDTDFLNCWWQGLKKMTYKKLGSK